MASRIPLWRRRIPKYPLYWKGNPQTKVFLCQFWMKLIKPKNDTPPDKVHFIVHPQMSKLDIKQYLEKIYKVPVLTVKTSLNEGKPIEDGNIIGKEDDYKVAHVQLGDGYTFEFPNVLGEGKSPQDKDMEIHENKKRMDIIEHHRDWDRMALPPWFRN